MNPSILPPGSVDWGCRIYQLHLCIGVRLLQRMSWLYIYIYIYVNVLCIYNYVSTNTTTRAGCDTRSIFIGVKQVCIQNFPSPWSVTIGRLKKPTLPYHLTMTGERIYEYNYFSLREYMDSYFFLREKAIGVMQTTSSRIGTRLVILIFNADKHYTTGNFCINKYVYVSVFGFVCARTSKHVSKFINNRYIH